MGERGGKTFTGQEKKCDGGREVKNEKEKTWAMTISVESRKKQRVK